MADQFHIPSIESNDDFVSTFSEVTHEKLEMGCMLLTDRINALNFRLRESSPGYRTDWHVAGDPTLIIVRQGTLRISLQNGECQDFSSGDMFIAKDYLPQGIDLDKTKHGHRAEVIGEQVFRAVHVKLGLV